MTSIPSTLVFCTKTDNNMMVQESNFSHHSSRAVMFKSSLSEMYKNHNIRWTTCKICEVGDLTQERFTSELVLGVDHCLCSLVGKQQEYHNVVYSHCKGKVNGPGDRVHSSNSDPGTVGGENNSMMLVHSGTGH